MKAYRLLTGKDNSGFCHRVTEALNNGWELYGGPSVTFDPVRGHVVCAQAIVKDAPERVYAPNIKLGDL
ncbi:DUF1737 domain-containing protein [Dichotomicrobium thermohalophilum]|uniref:DUF1737 domain-containing protein n=1 Tax=Dichotomicrobium thermohalophilum TaxID=933063 RepID=A0A397PEC2_9HYPH|nr:DUF1737 domain-containing protein [Dichotomicrobium thermohalophilum]RIA47308.1 hypothetical protein BXY53_2691 [Dichotomicrobium thermohalophilum]